MSIAPPTRPLPTPEPSQTDGPHSNGSTQSKASRKQSFSSTTNVPAGEKDNNRKERERDRASEILNGNSKKDTTPGKARQGDSVHSNPSGIRLQIQDTSERPSEWGANFWITIEDPMTHAIFYACPSTGQASWEPPQETFLMPLSDEGHWWELSDDSRGGIPYYYHTKSGETQWTKPEGFVIPLNIIQTTTTLGRRLSQNTFGRFSQDRTGVASSSGSPSVDRRSSMGRRSKSFVDSSPIAEEQEGPQFESTPTHLQHKQRRSMSNDYPTSPPPSKKSTPSHRQRGGAAKQPGRSSSPSPRKTPGEASNGASSSPQTPFPQYPQPAGLAPAAPPAAAAQSFGGIAQFLQRSTSKDQANDTLTKTTSNRPGTPPKPRVWFPQRSPSNKNEKNSPKESSHPQSPKRPIPNIPTDQTGPGSTFQRTRKNTEASTTTTTSSSTKEQKEISAPIPDPESAKKMSPINNRKGKPILVDVTTPPLPTHRFSTGDHYVLPPELQDDIQKFLVADFAKRYFSIHRSGLFFRRKVPVELMMSWQKAPLHSPLLVLNRTLHKDALKTFKVIQRIMGDRDRDKPIGVRLLTETAPVASVASSSTVSLGSQKDPNSVLEEERWMLAEGLAHGELRDEIYCQVIKQLSGNPNPESVFHGWQLLCVLLVTFPPSKNLEAYLRSYIEDKLNHKEGRIDIMAKHCIQRLGAISNKGPRGKPPTCQEIENAADAAFNPSTFGESLDAIFRLQQRTYPDGKVPIILPFLADSIIALGGTKREGIFRIPGDNDAISELKVRIDKGHYNLQGIDDPHVPASLLKLWLRELQDPLIPASLYNDCIACAEEPEQVVAIIKKLPTINRRVVLFVISFLQLFLPEHISSVTKMTSPNLALVMAPNLLRCNSESMSVVFTNSRFEHIFVHNLLLHLKCGKIDPDYAPIHGLGASASGTIGRPKPSRPRPT